MMTTSTNISATQQHSVGENDFYDLFTELDELEPFDIKKEELAAQLAALLSYSNKTRSEFAALSGWKKSRVTNILNGCKNLTFKTMWEFAGYLGYEADLHFRRPDETPAKQPWLSTKEEMKYIASSKNTQTYYVIHLQTASEVAKDIRDGNHKNYYFSIPTDGSLQKKSVHLDKSVLSDLVQIPIMTHIPKLITKETQEQK